MPPFSQNINFGGIGPADLPVEPIVPDFDPSDVVEVQGDDADVNVEVGEFHDPEQPASGHYDNLVEEISPSFLMGLASELIRKIKADDQSRAEWIETRARGMKLLGLQTKSPKSDGGDLSAPVEGISTYDDPLLLEAVIRGAANAFGELCPTDGPVKIRNDDLDPSQSADPLAEALERELNHFLTVTASEYYPETDRCLIMSFFGGTAFKKIYNCPIRNRPVSEGVDAIDLIVSNDVTDMRNAARVTHVIKMDPATFRRMQNLGIYSDASLARPTTPEVNAAEMAKQDITGLRPSDTLQEEDRERELYECYCKVDIPGFAGKGELLDGVPLPWRITIDKESEQIISVVRNWEEDDDQCLPTEVFVDYTYIRWFGFYGIGLLQILGNTTNGLSAATREMIDAGMFASFPGMLYALDGPQARQDTNIFRVAPGSGKGIQTGGKPIQQSVMGMPYNGANAELMALIEAVRQNGQRLGGTAEIQVGEGRQDAPVGTTLALIEQATKPLDAVHKRLYQSQAKEFQLLVKLFRLDPEALWRHNKRPKAQWTEALVKQALDDYDLTPVADPNTSSHMQRVARTSGLVQLALTSPPGLFNAYEVARKAVTDLRLGNAAILLNPNFSGMPQGAQDPSKMVSAQAQLLAAQAKMADAQSAQKIQAMESADVAKQEASKQKVAQIKSATDLAVQRQRTMADMAAQRAQLHANDLSDRRKIAADAMQKAADRTHDALQNIRQQQQTPPFGSNPQ